MELQPGAYFKVGQEGFEYVGKVSSEIDPSKPVVVARINPELPVAEGALHRTFDTETLSREGVKVGPFCEILPYSTYAREKTAWQTRFGAEIEVPYPPRLLVDTLRTAEEAGITSLEYHYLPGGNMERDGITIGGRKYLFSDIPDWKVPEDRFFQDTEPIRWPSGVQPPNISPETLSFPSCHILVDNTQKPDSQNGNQMYEPDSFKKLILDLGDKLSPEIEGSRFNISYDARAEHFDPALTQTLGLTTAVEEGKAKVTIPTGVIFNVVGNIFHPEWGNTSTYEWLEDKSGRGIRLVGGGSGLGGLSRFLRAYASEHEDAIGFRPLIVFPQEPIK